MFYTVYSKKPKLNFFYVENYNKMYIMKKKKKRKPINFWFLNENLLFSSGFQIENAFKFNPIKRFPR